MKALTQQLFSIPISFLCAVVVLTQPSKVHGVGNKIISFDGASAYVSIPSAPDLQNPAEWTIEAWINPQGGTHNYTFFVNKGDNLAGDSQRSYEVAWVENADSAGPGKSIRFTIFLSNGQWTWLDAPVAENTWVHVAGCFSSSQGVFQLFTNGVLANTIAHASGTPLAGSLLRQTSFPVLFGRSEYQPYFYAHGYMDEVRIWTKARTESEIASSMYCRLSGAEAGLAGYRNFDSGSSDDLTEHGHTGTLVGAAQVVQIVGSDVPHAGICGAFTYSVNGESCMITGYTGSNGAVVIPSMLSGLRVIGIGHRAFYPATNLTSIFMPEGLTTIDDEAFYDCFNLSEIALPNTLTNIGQLAFAGCYSLTNVIIPSSVVRIGEGGFTGSTKLLNFMVDSGNPRYTNISGVLFEKESMALVQFPVGRTGSYSIPYGTTRICGWAFNHGRSLIDIAVPNGLKTIGQSAFSDCYSLTSITLPSSVEQIEGFAFGHCMNLTNVFFQGNAPVAPNNLFYEAAVNAAVYYMLGSTGWGLTFGGVPAISVHAHAATCTLNVVNGFVVGATVTDQGWGYTNTPLIRIIGGGGSGAHAVGVLKNGLVTAVNIIAAGSGYTNKPIIVVSPPFVPQPIIAVSALVFGPIATPVIKMDFSDLSPYDNYQLEFRSGLTGPWTDLGGPFLPTASTNTQYADGFGTIGCFRIRYAQEQ